MEEEYANLKHSLSSKSKKNGKHPQKKRRVEASEDEEDSEFISEPEDGIDLEGESDYSDDEEEAGADDDPDDDEEVQYEDGKMSIIKVYVKVTEEKTGKIIRLPGDQGCPDIYLEEWKTCHHYALVKLPVKVDSPLDKIENIIKQNPGKFNALSILKDEMIKALNDGFSRRLISYEDKTEMTKNITDAVKGAEKDPSLSERTETALRQMYSGIQTKMRMKMK